MGKISPISAKYIAHAEIKADGVVDKPDVIGAIFGQTEGLLGSDLELRELQKSGRIGRIEVSLSTENGKTKGEITIPSSLGMAETSIIGASLETIKRIGPCDAEIEVTSIEDVRETKKDYIVDRAKELLRNVRESEPDSRELTKGIKESVRALELTEYGKDRLPAGPDVESSDELIVVEGRADVVNLLKNGVRNVISINGTSVPDDVKNLSKNKEMTAFVDGDRGGDLIVKELSGVVDLDYVAEAPTGKEVEELNNKGIHKALRAKMPFEQYEKEKDIDDVGKEEGEEESKIKGEMAKQFKKMLNELTGTKGAYVLDGAGNILGKVPVKELENTLDDLDEVNSVIIDKTIDGKTLDKLSNNDIEYLVAPKSKTDSDKVTIITQEDLS